MSSDEIHTLEIMHYKNGSSYEQRSSLFQLHITCYAAYIPGEFLLYETDAHTLLLWMFKIILL
jgi:hypothetical protein